MKTFPKLSWWQVALLTLAVSALGKLSTGTSKKKERALYDRKLKQAPWAPPGWVFGPAWTFNNFFLLRALQHLVQNKDMPLRQKLLVRQALIWIVFFSFGYVYFRKHSPVLAALWTLTDAGLALSSFLLANKEDHKLSRYYLPLLGWTGFASTVAVYQTIKNPDPIAGKQFLLN